MSTFDWQLDWKIESRDSPDDFRSAVAALTAYTGAGTGPGEPPAGAGRYLAQLLWQRRITADQLAGFLTPDRYRPTPAAALGPELVRALDCLVAGVGNPLAIWGDVTVAGWLSTALLREGLEPWFGPVVYEIPHRWEEGSGLTQSGLDRLIAAGCQLLLTMVAQPIALVEAAIDRGLTVIVLDSEGDRDGGLASPRLIVLQPRRLGPDHPLGQLSGVTLAYKVIEALRERIASEPGAASPAGQGQGQAPIDPLLDLVAIALIADWVELRGDSRYLAQRGMAQLQQLMPGPGASPRRPGVSALLTWCQRAGDRPMDRTLGLGPRIQAINQIQGDARLCLELLYSRDIARCRRLAEQVELLNGRRKTIQRSIYNEVRDRLPQRDRLSQPIVVLAELGWPIGLLGLVADQLVQDLDRPVLLFTLVTEPVVAGAVEDDDAPRRQIAQGVARSVPGLDLYDLLQGQRALLDRLSRQDLSLPAENLSLLEASLSQQLRQRLSDSAAAALAAQPYADLQVCVADLGPGLFRELKPLEPYGPGNPVPRLFVANCRFEQRRQANLKDLYGGKQRYIKTECLIGDSSTPLGFPAYWLGHYADELPRGAGDVIGELDFNSHRKRYELRLLQVRPSQGQPPAPIALPDSTWILDRRGPLTLDPIPDNALILDQAPQTWADLTPWIHRAIADQRPLVLAYSPTATGLASPAQATHHRLLGLAKYLSRTGETIAPGLVAERLGLGDHFLPLAWAALDDLGFVVTLGPTQVKIQWPLTTLPDVQRRSAVINQWLEAIEDARFQGDYFANIPLETIQLMATQLLMLPIEAVEPGDRAEETDSLGVNEKKRGRSRYGHGSG